MKAVYLRFIGVQNGKEEGLTRSCVRELLPLFHRVQIIVNIFPQICYSLFQLAFSLKGL